MTAIKIKDLREALKQDNTENTKTVDYNGLLVEIKQYLPMIEKITLVSSIYESAVNRDNGLHIILGNALDIAFKNLLVTTYTNITLPKNTMESYNLLCESGLYDFIYNNIPENEILAIKKALNNHIQTKQDEYEQKNTIQYIVKNLFNELMGKLPSLEEAKEFVASASKEIEGFDPSKMEYINEFLKMNKGENIG